MFRLVFFMAVSPMVWAQDRPVLAPEELLKLIPTTVEGFKPAGEPVARTIKIGTLSYSMAERSFARARQKIKILLFDYNNALIMYSQASNTGISPVDNVAEGSTTRSGNRYDYYRRQLDGSTCRIALGINMRFFLNITCENADESVLNAILSGMNFSGLERTPIEEPKFR
ncbi:MAG: hypothetical protein KatS3mg032_1746 [Cyclobacteriaceae bacterium]|nr:MAG: hypothetical protein KatS3mg032_1746 [Cyclobacteriaceae bacterium]